jgi:hypothetical protein
MQSYFGLGLIRLTIYTVGLRGPTRTHPYDAGAATKYQHVGIRGVKHNKNIDLRNYVTNIYANHNVVAALYYILK